MRSLSCVPEKVVVPFILIPKQQLTVASRILKIRGHSAQPQDWFPSFGATFRATYDIISLKLTLHITASRYDVETMPGHVTCLTMPSSAFPPVMPHPSCSTAA